MKSAATERGPGARCAGLDGLQRLHDGGMLARNIHDPGQGERAWAKARAAGYFGMKMRVPGSTSSGSFTTERFRAQSSGQRSIDP